MNWIHRQLDRGRELAWKKAEAHLLDEARARCPEGWRVDALHTSPGASGRDVHVTASGHWDPAVDDIEVTVTVRGLHIERREGENVLAWSAVEIRPLGPVTVDHPRGRLVMGDADFGAGHVVPARGIPEALRIAMGLVG